MLHVCITLIVSHISARCSHAFAIAGLSQCVSVLVDKEKWPAIVINFDNNYIIA